MSYSVSNQILLVDDDTNLLNAFKRMFYDKYHIAVADRATKGLEVLVNDGPFAVVISDMKMPDMNGIQFLTKAREISPDTVRIMLTGHADIDTAMHAVNEGNIFRFLLKPCQKDIVDWAIEAALEQFRLVVAERELLESTLKGSIQVLSDVLALANPVAFGKASRMKEYVIQLAGLLQLDRIWQYELAALFSQLGCVGLPADILTKVHSGADLSGEEQEMFNRHPELGANLLSRIPRLETISRMVACQRKLCEELGCDSQTLPTDEGVLGAQLLHVSADFDTLIYNLVPKTRAIAELRLRGGEYLQPLLAALERVEVVDIELQTVLVGIRELADNMVLAQDVHTRSGLLLAPKGHRATLSMRVRLENYANRNEIEKRILVSIPTPRSTKAAAVPVAVE